MTQQRSNDEIRERVRLLMAMCDSGKVRVVPTDPDDGVGVAWIRVMDAAAIAAASPPEPQHDERCERRHPDYYCSCSQRAALAAGLSLQEEQE